MLHSKRIDNKTFNRNHAFCDMGREIDHTYAYHPAAVLL
jgi:hypothetical protein